MPNETETAATTSDRAEQTTAIEAFAALERGANGGLAGSPGEWQELQARYRSVEQARQAHEATLQQLREQIEDQRERLAELARAAQTPLRTGQIDVILMRLSELERKIGEGASDPLLNEIVHRLAAIEDGRGGRGGRDPRVDDLGGQVEALKQRLEDQLRDPRTDDVVLRVAALEGAVRRAAKSADGDELRDRLEGLAAELGQVRRSELAALRGELDALRSATGEESSGTVGEEEWTAALTRVSAIEAALGERAEADRVERLEQRLAGTASADEVAALAADVRALRERVDSLGEPEPGAGEELEFRLAAIETRLAGSAAAVAVEDLRDRLARVEEQAADDEAEAVLAALRERLDSLDQRVERTRQESADGARVLELAGRLHALEARADASAATLAEVAANAGRLDALEASASAAGDGRDDADLAEIRAEVERLSVAVAEARSAAAIPVSVIDERLEQLEQRLGEVESAARLEDADGRLHGLEEKLRAIDDVAELGRRLTVLELDRGESGARSDEAGRDEARVEEVAREIERLRERVESAGAAGADSAAVAELRARIDSVAERLEAVADTRTASASDPRVTELIGRLEWVERRLEAVPAAPSALSAELVARLEALERGLSLRRDETPTSPGLDLEIGARLMAIENRVEELGARDAAGGADAALQRESERWSKWARSTLAEIGELRQRVEEIDVTASQPAAAPIDVESVTAIGTAVSNALRTAEVKALRSQMYFVYLSIGMLWAILLYVLFTRG